MGARWLTGMLCLGVTALAAWLGGRETGKQPKERIFVVAPAHVRLKGRRPAALTRKGLAVGGAYNCAALPVSLLRLSVALARVPELLLCTEHLFVMARTWHVFSHHAAKRDRLEFCRLGNRLKTLACEPSQLRY